MSEKFEVSQQEKIRKTEHGYEVSVDGKHHVQIDKDLGFIINMALTGQGWYDKGTFPSKKMEKFYYDFVRHINCHKMFLYLSGKISRKELLSPLKDRGKDAIRELINESTRKNPESFVWTFEEAESLIRSSDTFPMQMHLLYEDGTHLSDDAKPGVPYPFHTVTILGIDETGEIICFEKGGRHLNAPFAIKAFSRIQNDFTSHGDAEDIEPQFISVSPFPKISKTHSKTDSSLD